MKKQLTFLVLLSISFTLIAQKIIKLPYEKSTAVTWEGGEKEYFSQIWQTQVVTNVSVPTMEVFSPSKEKNNGSAVIIAPGGGLYAHSINSEGNDVAKWLVKKGFTAFVLKYRLVPSGDDAVAEMDKLFETDVAKIMENIAQVIPLSIEDGLNAITHVRENAKKYDVDPTKIGFMGFSAGGSVTMGVVYNYVATNKPNFIVPVYTWTDAMPVQTPKSDSPPMLVICAANDPLGLAKGSIDIFNSWYNQKLSVGLHMYSKGGHGFGMRKNGLPSDKWIKIFYDWSIAEGIVIKKKETKKDDKK